MRHMLASIALAFVHIGQAVLRHRLEARPAAAKHELAADGEGANCPQNFDGGRYQRNDMIEGVVLAKGQFLFHPLRRHPPDSIGAGLMGLGPIDPLEIGPLGMTDHAGPLGKQSQKPRTKANHRRRRCRIDPPHQLAHRLDLDQRWPSPLWRHRLERFTKTFSRIVGDEAQADRIIEHCLSPLTQAMSGFDGTTAFDLLQSGQQEGLIDLLDGERRQYGTRLRPLRMPQARFRQAELAARPSPPIFRRKCHSLCMFAPANRA